VDTEDRMMRTPPAVTVREASTGPAEAKGYDPAGRVNLAGYTASLVSYAALVAAAALVAGRQARRNLPERSLLPDLLVGGVATHKLSRLLAKGSVTSALRSPFTEFEAPAGAAEHLEHPRGSSGARHTIGELLTCPFCLDVWLGTAYVGALMVAPRPTRAVAAVFGVVAVSDWLHLGYEMVRKGALGHD
jgi:hypothetical protein